MVALAGGGVKDKSECRHRNWVEIGGTISPRNLSQPRAAYAGTYSHELLGDMMIALNDSQEMVVGWGRLTATASGYEEKDQVRVELVPNTGNVLAFNVDAERIESVSFQGMEFMKMR